MNFRSPPMPPYTPTFMRYTEGWTFVKKMPLCWYILNGTGGRPSGIGTPQNLLENIERGVDMFDCVMPTRNGRNANVFTKNGKLNLRNAEHKNNFSPIDETCDCYTCRTFSRSYLRHLFLAKEILGLQLATIHNLSFYQWLMREARNAIREQEFAEWNRH